MKDPAQQMLDAISQGRLCLHPAGTLPGIGWDLERVELWEKLLAFKGRAESKPIIGLISSLDKARLFWEEISDRWIAALECAWPGPLTVINQASWDSPINGRDGTLGLRVPDFSLQDTWMRNVLEELRIPFPSTSVNKSGDPAAVTWEEAVKFVGGDEIFVPKLKELPYLNGQASTVIRMIDDQVFQLLRAGAYDVGKLSRFGLKAQQIG